MTSDKTTTAFTPLRVALMIFNAITIIGALIAYFFSAQPWAYLLGIFSTVFILMLVFLILLELVWLNSMRINMTNQIIKNTYKKALIIYLALLLIGIVVSYMVLQLLILR